MSSRYGRLREVFPVSPGCGLVVAGSGFQASVQDADQPVGQPPEGVVMVESVGPLSVVEGAGAASRSSKASSAAGKYSRSWCLSRWTVASAPRSASCARGPGP